MTTEVGPVSDSGLEGYGDHRTPEEIDRDLAEQQDRRAEYRTGYHYELVGETTAEGMAAQDETDAQPLRGEQGEQYDDVEVLELRNALEAIVVKDKQTVETLADIAEELEGVLSALPREMTGDRTTLHKSIHRLEALANATDERSARLAEDYLNPVVPDEANPPLTAEDIRGRGAQFTDSLVWLRGAWERGDLEEIKASLATLQTYWDEGRRDIGLTQTIDAHQRAISDLEDPNPRSRRRPADIN